MAAIGETFGGKGNGTMERFRTMLEGGNPHGGSMGDGAGMSQMRRMYHANVNLEAA